MLQKKQAIEKLNVLGKEKTPFVFYCDFLGERWFICQKDKLDNEFDWNFGGYSDESKVESRKTGVEREKSTLHKAPISFETFKKSFDQVVAEINIGNSFLTNLTFQTPVETSLSLAEIYETTQAKYKLHVPGEFVVFSPETFVQIRRNEIYSYPMKGTIDAQVPNAATKILADQKEIAEHITIVDLIRNDLSQVASNVQVPRFRYLDRIETSDKQLLQVSSEVRGELQEDWRENLGNILTRLLPAGSISGAPKPQTVKIIQRVETHVRGFYTGICGQFDGESLDTGVMIRFIKKEGNQLFYCSGGGITSFSQAEKEYQEMIDKIYLPNSYLAAR